MGGYQGNNLGRWILVLIIFVLFVGAVFVFQKQTGNIADNGAARAGNSGSSRVYTVFYTSGVFSPTNLSIELGDTVVFRNMSGQMIELASALEQDIQELFGGKQIAPGRQHSIIFTQTGLYPYINKLNNQQRGAVIVTAR